MARRLTAEEKAVNTKMHRVLMVTIVAITVVLTISSLFNPPRPVTKTVSMTSWCYKGVVYFTSSVGSGSWGGPEIEPDSGKPKTCSNWQRSNPEQAVSIDPY